MWLDVLLHGLPFRHGEGGDAAVVLLLLGLGVAGAASVGLWLARWVESDPANVPLASAFGLGALLFLFFDLLKESASLGQGLLSSPLLPVGLVTAFAAAAVGIPFLSRDGTDASRVAWWWTAGISAHGAAEGWIVGTEAAQTDPFGAPLGAASFLIHKALEAFTIRFVAGPGLPIRWDAGYAAALAAAATGGGLVGLWWGPSLTVLLLFAAGAGASTFAMVRLARGMRANLVTMVAITAGVVLVWAAGLLHEL